MSRETLNDVAVLIEDDPVIASVINYILEGAGIATELATSAESGIETVRRVRPRIVLLDVNLPDRSGVEVCETIRQDADIRDTFVLFISTHDEGDLVAMSSRVEADGYLCKPFDPDLFLGVVRGVMRDGNRQPSPTEPIQGSTN